MKNICNIPNVISHNYDQKQSPSVYFQERIKSKEFQVVVTLSDAIGAFVMMMGGKI